MNSVCCINIYLYVRAYANVHTHTEREEREKGENNKRKICYQLGGETWEGFKQRRIVERERRSDLILFLLKTLKIKIKSFPASKNHFIFKNYLEKQTNIQHNCL